MRKLRVGIVGATGNVGRVYFALLQDHPYFELTYVAGSKKSISKPFHGFLLEDPLSFKKNIQEFCKITYFEGLYIHAFQEEGKKGYVTFTAKLSQNGIDASFQEKSLFLKEEGIWLYVEGEFSKEKKPVFD